MLLREQEVRAKILEGFDLLYDAVAVTLGPKGRNFLIKNKFGEFKITHDGVSVANSIRSDDPQIQMGIDLLKEASRMMNKIGDGTTSVTVLTRWLVVNIFALLAEKLDENPMIIRKQLEEICEALIVTVEANSRVIEQTEEAVYNAAFISVADAELATAISKLMVGTGYEGAISVETTKGKDTTFKLEDGYLVPSGYASPAFITDEKSKEAILEKPAVILIDGKMDSLQTYAALIDELLSQKVKSFFFMADNINDEVLTLLVQNKLKGTLKVVFVQNAGTRERLEDIAAVTGAKIVNGNADQNPEVSDVGMAAKINVRQGETFIIGGEGNTTNQLNALRSKNAQHPDELLEERIALLSTKVGVIKVGGNSDTETSEKKDRIDDAVAATREAIKGGIVAGGGVTLRDLAVTLHSEDDKVSDAVAWALRMPYQMLLVNSGHGDRIMLNKQGYGIDVITGKVVNTMETGIVDPTNITVNVIRNAFAVAIMTITVGGAFVDEPLSEAEKLAYLGVK